MKKHSIGIKLGMAFGLLVAILIGVGWLGLCRMDQVNASLDDILSRQWTKVQLARGIEFYANQNNQIATDVFLLNQKQDWPTLMKQRAQNKAMAADLMVKLEQRLDSDQEKKLYAKLIEAKAPFNEAFGRVMTLVLADKPDEARELMLKEAIPLRDKFYAARNALVNYEDTQLSDARYASESEYQEARMMTSLLIFLAILLAVAIAVVVTIKMTHEVSEREEAKMAVRMLNESLEKKVEGRTRELAAALEALQSEVMERRQTEEALRQSEQNFRSLVENSPYGIFRVTPDHRLLLANRALLDMLGYSSESEILGMDTSTEFFRSPAEHKRLAELYKNQNEVKGVEVEWKRKDGAPFTIRYGRHNVTDDAGNLLHKEVIVEDVTERRALEQQLRQAQKMEAVGRLAGGIAHDFNNLLGVIVGYSELLLDQPGTSAEARAHAEQIKKAGNRAGALTRQMLAFSRQQVLEPTVLSLNTVVAEMQKMLPRIIGEDVQIQVTLDPALERVKADQNQIEQVIMNLAVNARDAMPDGGRLTLETADVELDETHAGMHRGMIPGRYAVLTVSDSGIGMDARTMAHMFEPFFTTKGPGRGTGLGLATVYGVIKQSGGYIYAESEPGQGTTFRVYLPHVEEKAAAERPAEAGRPPAGSETILLVEDEESLRTLAHTLLERAGYTILEAGDGIEAMEIARQHDGEIHLLLTDVVMPGMNGRAVAEQITSVRPRTKVMYMSGYADFKQQDLSHHEAKFIQKPFTSETLLRMVHEALEAESHRSAHRELAACRA